MSDANPPHGPLHIPNPAAFVRHSREEWMTAALFGFLGGILPSALRLASVFASAGFTAGDFDPPRATFYAALLLYGFAGAVVSAAFKQFASREAFIAGIVAPSLVTNIVGGLSEGAIKQPVRVSYYQSQLISSFSFFSTIANAQTKAQPPTDPMVYSGSDSVLLDPDQQGPRRSVKFIFDLSRKDIVVAKVRVDFMKDTEALSDDKTVFVSPTFEGSILVPDTFKYIRVDKGDPLALLPEPVQVVVHADVRTSLGFDFVWALGGIREYKVKDVSTTVLPVADLPMSQTPHRRTIN
jgi:hypothetical protein